MKKFIVDTGKKKYSVEANDAEHAVELVKKIDDEASPLQTVNALLEDERAAVDAYNVAIENLRGKIPEESLQAIIAIRDDENRHIENLQAVVNGTVTEKNLEDSMKDELFVIEAYWRGAKINGEKRQWLVGRMATTDLNRADKFTSEQQAKAVIRFQNIGNHARVVRMSSIRDDENGTVIEKNLEDSTDAISTKYKDRDAYVRRKGEYWIVEYETAPYMYDHEHFKTKNEALSWAKSKGFGSIEVIEDKTKDASYTEKNLEDSMMNDGIVECYEALEKAKDAISAVYKNYAKEQDSEYMLKKLNEASSAIARAIRQYKAW